MSVPGWSDELLKLLVRSQSVGFRETFVFHRHLSTDVDKFKSMYDALKTPNPSRGTAITHSKFFLLLSALRNESAPVAMKDTLKKNNRKAFEDIYYRSLAKVAGVL